MDDRRRDRRGGVAEHVTEGKGAGGLLGDALGEEGVGGDEDEGHAEAGWSGVGWVLVIDLLQRAEGGVDVLTQKRSDDHRRGMDLLIDKPPKHDRSRYAGENSPDLIDQPIFRRDTLLPAGLHCHLPPPVRKSAASHRPGNHRDPDREIPRADCGA